MTVAERRALQVGQKLAKVLIELETLKYSQIQEALVDAILLAQSWKHIRQGQREEVIEVLKLIGNFFRGEEEEAT